jgi:broad specificity phosphatase PhoE
VQGPRQCAAMGTLYLVRHGQASFGAADYDLLSELGVRQCERLGQWFAGRGTARFDAVVSGTLTRHRQSLAALLRGLATPHPVTEEPGLNEYDADALVRAVSTGALAPARTPDEVRAHFRLLRDGLRAWIEGRVQPAGMGSHASFVAGVANLLDAVRTSHADGNVLVLSSGGPIATAVGLVLGLAPEAVIDLNLNLRNSALSELRVTPRRLSLVTFNTLPHLDGAQHAAWVTHA